jgi:8-amino-7-oxononanoate synthase
MGTLSKAVGAYGGYLCAAMPVIELMRNRARSFIYTTGLPPAAVAAAIAALDVMASEPDLVGKPLAKARLFTTLLDLPPAQSAIVPLIIGDEKRALAAAAALGEQGFLVVAIRPPTVPPGTARLRFAFAAQHDDDDIRRLAAAVQTLLAKP